ncbi:molybdate ABC transporter substrate-binding protein [uncultured Litoreibacter sp.]|uniref:molybdate ABC transporter substrate-binding protein n=1 Tax=uncultured Litoreibacter sp. TaxID=1392394 RepID=UPI00262D78BC|nr:molybdate ABC transporter substrate-binding protein [uncultured Litoreibacter sp.]
MSRTLRPYAARTSPEITLAPAAPEVTIARMLLTRRHMIALGAAACTTRAYASEVPTVFAAASLKSVLDEIASEVTPMRLVYAGSGTLARQIQQGAPADLFISANAQWMDAVRPQIMAGTRRDLLGNALVIVGPQGHPPLDLSAAPKGRIAMGFTNAVPAGQYAKAAFEKLDLWDQLEIVETDNVRAALVLAARGEVPFAVTYATDARADPRVKILHRFAPNLHPPITYPMAALSPSYDHTIQALTSPEAAAIFKAAGFTVL